VGLVSSGAESLPLCLPHCGTGPWVRQRGAKSATRADIRSSEVVVQKCNFLAYRPSSRSLRVIYPAIGSADCEITFADENAGILSQLQRPRTRYIRTDKSFPDELIPFDLLIEFAHVAISKPKRVS
jgi:hypothetical protein